MRFESSFVAVGGPMPGSRRDLRRRSQAIRRRRERGVRTLGRDHGSSRRYSICLSSDVSGRGLSEYLFTDQEKDPERSSKMY